MIAQFFKSIEIFYMQSLMSGIGTSLNVILYSAENTPDFYYQIMSVLRILLLMLRSQFALPIVNIFPSPR